MFFIYKFEWFNAFVFSTCARPLWKSSSVSLRSTMSSSILYTYRLFSNVLYIFVVWSTKIIFILQCHLWTNSIYNRFFNIVTSIVPFLCFKSLKYLVFFSPYLSFASWKLIFKYSYTGDILCVEMLNTVLWPHPISLPSSEVTCLMWSPPGLLKMHL